MNIAKRSLVVGVLAAGIAVAMTPAAQAATATASTANASCSTSVHAANGADGMVIIGDAVGVGNGSGALIVRSGCARPAVTRVFPPRTDCRDQPLERVRICLEIAQRIDAEFIRRAAERIAEDNS